MTSRPSWKLQMPRVKCPECGCTLRCSFSGRFRVLGLRQPREPRKEKGEETREEGTAVPCDAAASAEPDEHAA